MRMTMTELTLLLEGSDRGGTLHAPCYGGEHDVHTLEAHGPQIRRKSPANP